MIDTNAITQLAGPQTASALNAWLIVAAGAGAVLTHAYHVIVLGGGLKNIIRKFWNGDSVRTEAGAARTSTPSPSNSPSPSQTKETRS